MAPPSASAKGGRRSRMFARAAAGADTGHAPRVEPTGIEPVTSGLQSQRSPS